MGEDEALDFIGGPGTVVYLWSQSRPEEGGIQRLADAVGGAIDPAEAEALCRANNYDTELLCAWLEERGCPAVKVTNIRLSWPRAGVLVMGPDETARLFGGDTAAAHDALMAKRRLFHYWTGMQVHDWYVTDDGYVDDGYDVMLEDGKMYPMVGDIVDMGGPVIGNNNADHALRDALHRYRERLALRKQERTVAKQDAPATADGFSTAYDLYRSSKPDRAVASRQLRAYSIQSPDGIGYYVTDDGSPFDDGRTNVYEVGSERDMVGDIIWRSNPPADEDTMHRDSGGHRCRYIPIDKIREDRRFRARLEEDWDEYERMGGGKFRTLMRRLEYEQ